MVELIRTRAIASQEELAEILAQSGYKVTQATLSRDLKMLNTTKVPTDRGTYMYVLPDSNTLKDKLLAANARTIRANYSSGFESLSVSGNIAVIKTRNGYAAGLAFDIDTSRSPEILGTIPGSDTILAVMRDDLSHDEIWNVFARILPVEPRVPLPSADNP